MNIKSLIKTFWHCLIPRAGHRVCKIKYFTNKITWKCECQLSEEEKEIRGIMNYETH